MLDNTSFTAHQGNSQGHPDTGLAQMDLPAHLSVEDISWPCALPAATQESLLRIARHYDHSQLVGPLPGVLYVASGSLVGYATSTSMDNSLGLVFGRGCWFGIQSIHNPGYVPTEYFESLTPTELILFPREELEPLLAQDPEIYKLLFYIAQYIGRIVLQMGSNGLHCLTTRITYVLLELAIKHVTANESAPRVVITQQTLSQIVGISRPRVNEVLKLLADEGELLLGRGEITLLDLPALKARLPPPSFTYHDPAPKVTQEASEAHHA